MGFKVLVLGSAESIITRRLGSLIDEMPWVSSSIVSDPSRLPDLSDASASALPNIVISVASGDSSDAVTLALLKRMLPVCEHMLIPIIQTSTYQAVGDYDALSEVPETTQPSRDNTAPFCAQMETLVGKLEKRIVLRRSWIMDGAEDSLFGKLVPLIRNAQPYAVSENNYGRPIRFEFLISAVIAIVQQVFAGSQNWGTYHLLSSERCSEAEFCDQLLRQLRSAFNLNFPSPNIIKSEERSACIEGAANLSGNKLKEDFGIQPSSWRQGFSSLLTDWVSATDECQTN